ncbi:hypothetical protein ACH5RR_025210 [Cinchona calisaya]|uniref:Zinc finger PHD-type domain-containing protein n=1 Tax=Cinchona calisaya TaxID=153742 RepID=A0ABD2Z406_9GENT
MGRFDNVPSPNMKHFSHPHELQLQQIGLANVNDQYPTCSACKLPALVGENMYICKSCNFLLHLACAEFPQLITHPAHKNHILTLLPVAAYPGGFFNCDACNCQGNGFSYHCSSCEYDLHVLCASKPLKFTHKFHSCQLDLTFTSPYSNTKGFSCDVCKKFGCKQWLYRCASCEFDVHLDCTSASSPAPAVALHRGLLPQILQHNRSFPGGSGSRSLIHHNNLQVGLLGQSSATQSGQSHILDHHHREYMHSANLGANPNVLMHSASAGELRGNVQRPNYRTSGLMNSVIGGVVEGGAQQFGQSFMQGVIGGGAAIGGGGGGGGGDGTSILGGFLGDSFETQN